MIPLRDSQRSRSLPVANLAIIALNALVFLHMLGLGPRGLTEFILTYGLVPRLALAELAAGDLERGALPFVTAMFLHAPPPGGWLHILGNMLYLWVFGDNVEDSVGHFRYLVFYLLAGIGANVAHVVANPESPLPVIGASGAVAGVLGAYFVRFPRSRVLALVPLGFFLTLTEVPAIVFLLLWFVIQLASGLLGSAGPGQVVAWWAHIGGFVAGVLLIRLFLRRRRVWR